MAVKTSSPNVIVCANAEQHKTDHVPEYFWTVNSKDAVPLGWKRDASDMLCPACVERIMSSKICPTCGQEVK